MSGPEGIPAGPAPVRAVLLDALGTLVSLEPPGPRLRAELARRGFEVSEGASAAAFRAEIDYYLEHHLEGRDARSLADLRDRCAEVVRATLAVPRLDHETARAAMLAALSFRAQPDAPGALAALRAQGLRLVAASNWDCSLPRVLEHAGLAPLLDGVVTSAEVGAAKPDPRVLEAALAVAGARAEEAVHVGDSADTDLPAAVAAGVRAVLLDRTDDARAWGSPPGPGETGPRSGAPASAPPAIIRTLAELPSLVLEPR